MRIADTNVVPHPRDRVWDALLDPRVLTRAIPGCERLESTGEHAYAMTVTAGVAAVKGTYDGSCRLADLVERESLVMTLSGAGSPGTVDARVEVHLADAGEGATAISYDADATVGGMVGGVGQRMLTSVSKRMARQFFDNVGDSLAGVSQPVADAVAQAVTDRVSEQVAERISGRVSGRPGGPDDFARGVAVGAGLVLLGVVAGAVLGGRR